MKQLALKGFMGAIVLYFTELQHDYGTILWVVLAMATIDIMLNVHQEGKQFNKLGSAFVAIGAPTLIGNSINNPTFIHTVLAVVAIAYIQVLYPQLITLIGKEKVSKASKQQQIDMLNQLTAKVDALAQAQDGQVKIPVSTNNQ